jgi:murein DD-endopeptidase MepM/ murein hydrolase activator NlpD
MSLVKLKHIRPLGEGKYEKGTGLLYRSAPSDVDTTNLVGKTSGPDVGKVPRYELPSNNIEEREKKFMYNTSINTGDDSEISVQKNDKFIIGKTEVTITDPYGIRKFKGREGKHSTGIDYVTNNGQVVALTDLEIVGVKLQGSGATYKPDAVDADGNQLPGSAGYYIITKNSDGTMSQYMHLDPMTKAEMARLKGQKFKKGDSIWGYSTGSGSMTAPHVKVRFANGMPSSSSYINPTKYFLGV